ncbi:hypothetical protein HOLleu_40425 [Holothuria leucospilota]|uniref:Uncharacterized protein n=1 Tax=Holothuria leucospilota TaxID=206669 RepID=A0A9Q0YL05_HOLLE|nr:hypothetical protein HOLleu_40425 [Holothuria leucospilota]
MVVSIWVQTGLGATAPPHSGETYFSGILMEILGHFAGVTQLCLGQDGLSPPPPPHRQEKRRLRTALFKFNYV